MITEYMDIVENIGEKCGQIYRNSSNFFYKCLNCCSVFQNVDFFRNHILNNYDKTCKTKNETNNVMKSDYNTYGIEENQSKNVLFSERQSQNSHKIPLESNNKVQKNSRKRGHSKENNSTKLQDERHLKVRVTMKRRIADKIQWQLDKVFSNEIEAQHYIQSQKIWSFLHKNLTKKGVKKYYRCNRVKFRGQQCASSMLYFFNENIGKCEVYKSKSEHTCDKIGSLQTNSRITAETKSKIENLYEKGMKLKDVIYKAENEFNVKSGQVKNFLKLLKIKKEKTLKTEVEEWIEISKNFPDLLHQPFVVNCESDENILRFFISSRNLLSNASNTKVVNINGVKKLNWHMYTIFFPGTIDNNNQFKCFGIAVCQKDEIEDFCFIFKSLIDASQNYFNKKFSPMVLFRDSNLNVEKAFQNIFDKEDNKVKICWNHVRNRLKTKLEYLLPEHHNKKEEILNDLDYIQKSTTFKEFKEAIDDFVNKWALYVEFITYFHQEWVDKNFNWFEGIDKDTISNNRMIDQFIKKIQNDEQFRERLPFKLFKKKLFDWISELSIVEFPDSENLDTLIETDIKGSKISKRELLLLYKSSYNLNQISQHDDAQVKTLPVKQKGPKTSYKTTVNTKSSILKTPQCARKRRSEKLWKEEMTFHSLTEAEMAVESEKIWSLSTKNRTKAGTKIYFRCNKVPFRGMQCNASLYLFLKSDCTKVILVRSGLSHNCHEIAFKSRGIDKEIRAEIDRLNDLSWKPSQILDYIQDKNYKSPPTKTQISNYLAVLRERKYGASNIDQEQLKCWLNNCSQVPDNDNKMFVVAHECVDGQYQFLFSSKKLLQNGFNIKYIHIDDVHKLEWIKYPIYFLGVTDDQLNFHSLGLAICYNNEERNFNFIFKSLKEGILRIYDHLINPRILVTDTNSNLQSAFNNIFKNAEIKICCDIFRKNIRKKLDEFSIPKENITKIQKDLENICKCTSELELDKELTIFKSKWSEYNEFMCNFAEEWIKSNKSWFQGYDISSHIKNTKLEGFVKLFKNDELYRKKISIESFSKIISKCIKTWSLDCKAY